VLVVTALLAMATFADAQSAVPNPRERGVWVSDVAAVIPEDAEARMNALIDALERKVGVEIAILTMPDVEGTPKEFAVRIANEWGVGKKDRNNGLVVLLVTGQRRLEMETGYGLEGVLPDGWLGEMQNALMVPAFKRGDYGAGLETGLAQIVARIEANPEEARDGMNVPTADLPVIETEDRGSPGAVPWILGLGALAGGVGGVRFGIRRWQRRCRKCRLQMTMLDEQADDAHLDEGQKHEEKLRSVDYQVYRCIRCEDLRVLRDVRWFSRWSRCEACRYRTMRTDRRVLVPPTTISPGLMQIDLDCAHCRFSRSFQRILPRISTSSSGGSGGGSSSSSRGGSFGGGRSGGGGAGSSW
jgi:uncharacterized protein